MVLIEPGPSHDFLTHLGAELPRPRAFLSVTAHWMTRTPTVSSDPQPDTAHDFGGFPDPLYQITYPAPGAPDVARAAANSLNAAGIETDVVEKRAFDHGTWTPLQLAYPEANIPVAELSIQPHRSPKWHYDLGRALAPLRDDGVMIIASGAMTHNLTAWARGGLDTPPTWVTDFTDWVRTTIAEKRWNDLLQFEDLAPYVVENHPTTEHFLPLFVALGAARDGAEITHLFDGIDYGVLAMDAYRFD